MKYIKSSAAVMSLLLLQNPVQVFAQDEEEISNVLEEIVVTGRKREENLMDVPVSVSVLSADLIAEQNVLRQGDLADLIPGLWYNEGTAVGAGESDRIAALPSIRGISSSEIATNRTLVSSFVDGIPVIGSVGAINIGGATQVEVFNGPQSAAFGRSTFGGAINYVTQNPGDEFSGNAGINWSDQGTRILSGSVGGPLVEGLLGFQLGGSFEDSVAPDDFYTYSDGTEAGTIGGENYSARFVFTPTDALTAKLTFSHDETDDGITARNFYATQESAAACFDTLTTFDRYDGRGMEGSSFSGVFDCELERDTDAALLGVQDIGAFYRDNLDLLDQFVDAISDAPGAMGAASDLEIAEQIAADAGFDTIQEAMLAIADAYSVPEEFVGSQSERDRVQLQLDYLLENDSLIQFSYMDSEETYIREDISYDSATPYELGFDSGVPDAMAMGAAAIPGDPAINWVIDGRSEFSMSDPTVINEEYFELRWASPAEERIRYVVGASSYEYDFLTEIYNEGYNAVRLGTEQAIYDLTGEVVSPGRTISEITTNTAVFFNVNYDFTDKLTGSLEGRYSEDDVGAELFNYTADDEGVVSTNRFEDAIVTKTFSPRLSLTYAINDDTNAYAQYAIGVNPAGINSAFLDPDVINSFNEGYLLDLNADGTVDLDEIYVPGDLVNYDLDRYGRFDEEKLTNYEIGFKGVAFDGRVSYSAALYHMIWDDQSARISIDWEHPNVTNDEDLYYTEIGNTGELYIPANDNEDDTVETGVGGFFTNQGQSTTTGLELQANYQINDSWSVSGNTSLMKAEYSDYCSEDDFNGIDPTIVDGVVTVYSDAGHFAGLEESVSPQGNPCYILDGNKLARQPHFTFSMSPSYRTEFDNGIGFSANTRFQYSSSSYNDAENTSKTPSSFRVNLTLGLTWENFSSSFYIENLLDDTSVNVASFVEDTIYEGIYGADTVNQDLVFRTSDASARNYSTFQYSIPTGRNYGLRLNYRF